MFQEKVINLGILASPVDESIVTKDKVKFILLNSGSTQKDRNYWHLLQKDFRSRTYYLVPMSTLLVVGTEVVVLDNTWAVVLHRDWEAHWLFELQAPQVPVMVGLQV
jgi:hypothetical protein